MSQPIATDSLRAAIAVAMSKAPRCDAACLVPIRQYNMLDVVKAMEPELTSKEPKTAPLALQVLSFAAIERVSEPTEGRTTATADNNDNASTVPSSVIISDGSSVCSTETLEVLFAFLVTKINHFTTIDSAVDAVSRIFVWYATNHPHLLTTSSANTTTPILKSVINNMLCKISVPSMFGNSKASAFALIKALLLPAVVNSYSREETNKFLEAFLVSVDGERDPAYVLDVFTMAYTILTSFSASALENYTEDYFMTLSNYFPVLFNPPARCTVTKDELKTALTRVLVLPVFHEVCIPFVLSKLSSPAEVAKVDSLALLHDIFNGATTTRTSLGDVSIVGYSPSLLASHVADVLGSLRGEALKLASSVAYNPSAKELLRLVMGVAEDLGRVLDALGGGSINSSNDTTATKSGVTPSQRDAILSHCDRMLTACMGTVEAGSDARAYAMLLNSMCRAGDAVAGVLAGYVLPMVGIRLLGIDTATNKGGKGSVSDQEERIYMSAVAVLGGILSALETRRNISGYTNTSALLSIAIKPQTTQTIVNALFDVVINEGGSGSPHPLEDALPLIVEVLCTFVAVRDLLPGGADLSNDTVDNNNNDNAAVCPSTRTILRTLLKRACDTTATESDSAIVAFKAISNVARVAPTCVLASTVCDNALCYELAGSSRLPAFFTQLHNAVGMANREVRQQVFDALLLGGDTNKITKPILTVAVDIFGYNNATIDNYLRAIALFVASEAADIPTTTAACIPAVVQKLLELTIPEQCASGADLLCELLARCPSEQSLLLGGDDSQSEKASVSWLCAVASADNATVVKYYASCWVGRCLRHVAAGASSGNSHLRALALRAVASIANKGDATVVSANTFEAAMGHGCADADHVPLAAGEEAAVRAAVCKGLLARGADAKETLSPLLAAVAAYSTEGATLASPTVSGTTGTTDAAQQLLIGAFGELLSPPFPTAVASSTWLQRTYVCLVDALLSSAPTPVGLVCLAETIARAPLKVVAATSSELVEKLTAVLDNGNRLRPGEGGAAAHNTNNGRCATITSNSVAAMLCVVKVLERADGMPIDAVRAAATALLTYSETSVALYTMTYAVSGPSAKHSIPRVTMAVRDVLLSALLATHAVVAAGLPSSSGGGVGKVGRSVEDPLRLFAKEASKKWIFLWLRTALDDPKRPMRVLAAKCSHEWHKVK